MYHSDQRGHDRYPSLSTDSDVHPCISSVQPALYPSYLFIMLQILFLLSYQFDRLFQNLVDASPCPLYLTQIWAWTFYPFPKERTKSLGISIYSLTFRSLGKSFKKRMPRPIDVFSTRKCNTTNRRLGSCFVLLFTTNDIAFSCLNLWATHPRLGLRHGCRYGRALSESLHRAALRVRRCSLCDWNHLA